ncbi:D-aspartate oxidase [Anabrus simplex]|uniref:D-aspartate oxidase n=1 Tax=Anabrus simplex TaxID=316456 RepID=UPI0034DD19DD
MDGLHIGILGAGIVGMTTALELQREFPKAHLTIIADSFNQNTTSHGAAGIFRPSTNFCGPTEKVTSQWIRDSWNYYDELRQSEEAADAGVSSISGYCFSSISPDIVRNHFLEQVVPVYRAVTREELDAFPGNWQYGSFYTTVLTESPKFLPWAARRFLHSSGKIIKKHITSFSDIASDFDIVVNCLGLGAKYLCSDNKLVPIRGQIIKVRAPWIKTFLYAELDTYIIPTSNDVTLGGCRQYESYAMAPSKYDHAAILERCTSLVPNLKSAAVLRDWVGLRPHRSTVRVEPEVIQTQAGKLKVVHNYGHGGYGVTSAPGTAKHAVKLVKDLHAAGVHSSKL